MNVAGANRIEVLDALDRALQDWVRHGNEQSLTRWLERQLDPRGVPIRLPIADWHVCVTRVMGAHPDSRAWPNAWRRPITRLIQATRRFTHRDGRPVIDLDPASAARGRASESTRSCSKTGLNGQEFEQIIKHIQAKTENGRNDDRGHANGRPKDVFEVLRPGWPAEDDFLAIDHRAGKPTASVELFGGGQSWLGPTWQTEVGRAATSVPRLTCWIEEASGTLAEWTYRAGEVRITQSALLLANRSLALLSTLIEYPAPGDAVPGMMVSLWPEVTTTPIENCRGLVLKHSNHRGSAQVLPIGLPSLLYPTERGAFLASDERLMVRQAATGRRVWLPLVISWDPKRHRKETRWRVLSVSEKSRNVASDRAFAARVSWGRDETYVIYRSLAKPAPRAFLGHQTVTRFLVGTFNRAGVVEPIFKVE